MHIERNTFGVCDSCKEMLTINCGQENHFFSLVNSNAIDDKLTCMLLFLCWNKQSMTGSKFGADMFVC